MSVKFGVIGGTGLYEMPGIEELHESEVKTPFGDPSDKLISGRYHGVPVVFLPRHGRGHRFMPTAVPYRANLFALKSLGVTHVISVSACGSLKEELRPGDVVVIDQFVDRTRHRDDSFFGQGLVAHVSFADPICPCLAKDLYDTAGELGIPAHWKGTYLCMEGPQFSTRAESLLYRSWGMDVIGMTNLTEARLAREAELHFATLAMVTDYDCWRTHDADVDINDILRVMAQNSDNAKKIIGAVIQKNRAAETCGCAAAMAGAIVTDPKRIPATLKADLALLIGKYVK
ncbi:MAG: S-methyl-5'-thioadenosine phosphorylase [Myxococcales bacterium]|nr:S-methyl-5'-thioadenosine phosphorylase [Myxococcales bacterium]